jgi:hypothetical protein
MRVRTLSRRLFSWQHVAEVDSAAHLDPKNMSNHDRLGDSLNKYQVYHVQCVHNHVGAVREVDRAEFS